MEQKENLYGIEFIELLINEEGKINLYVKFFVSKKYFEKVSIDYLIKKVKTTGCGFWSGYNDLYFVKQFIFNQEFLSFDFCLKLINNYMRKINNILNELLELDDRVKLYEKMLNEI